MPKVICLNGPKHSGRDTIGVALKAALVKSGYNCIIEKFAQPLKDGVACFLGLNERMAHHYFENPAVKDHPSSNFFGMTPCQVLISFSEEWAKPKFGKEVFGVLMRDRIEDLDGFVVVTDCGFREELEPLDPTDLAVVRLHRHKTNFDNDSRGYIYDSGLYTFDVRNESEPDYVAQAILYSLTKEGFLTGLEKKAK